MASSDDEEEVMPQSVTNYYFVDEKEEPIAFSVLRIQFDEAELPDAPRERVFLRGNADGGLQKVYKQVTAWKLVLEDEQPEVLVLSKDNKWIKLLKPRRSYEDCIRTILIMVQLLHFLRRKPESLEKSLWDHLRKVFSSFEDRPSVNDLADHYSLIKLFIEKDESLAKSQLLLMLLKEKPMKENFGEDLQNDSDAKKPFIVDDDDVDEGMGDVDGNESEEDSDLFDSVCAICDNGGELLCCEGRCMRSFHASRKAGEDSDCKSLGFSRAQVEAIQNFLCKNCQYKLHQCFACGKLGSSDKSAGAEVFPCVNATCGHFYHPKCVADLLFPDNETEAAEYQKKVAGGESFACPVHKCIVCKQGENKEVEELQFAMCRRCPKSYHRKCLPRKIAFEDIEEEGIIQRAWDDLLPNRILIYCLKHKIDEDLATPIRNHIIFPEIPEKKNVMDVQKSKVKVVVKRNRQVPDDLPRDRTSVKPVKAIEKRSSSEESHSVVRSGRSSTEQVLGFQKQFKPLKVSVQSGLQKANGSIPVDSKKSPKEKAKASVPTVSPASVGNFFFSSFPKIDGETEKRMIALLEQTSSSLTLEDIMKKRTVPSTHACSARHIDKSVTQGKVEGSVEAIRTALQKLEDGCSVEDAKAVCEPDILKQLLKWSSKLRVYLAPFLHGMRYTSFGRHFTKVDKLKEIVDKLQWFVQNGDTIVDFCCGANDFSRLMKEKLDAAGKKCSFKNYDVIQPKNDFNFEKRDWMMVQPEELPTGSQLIMGLNPPFGVKAALANKFIDKALTFKPKLLILIVPKETKRLDQKKSPYDLIWEDCEKLSGKSFYLPGSVDVNDQQMEQWNLKPPPLYLWSRPDWTAKHKAIALKHGHTSKEQQESPLEEEIRVRKTPDARPSEEHIEERHEKREATTPGETRREGNNKKNAEQSNKRSPPECHKGMSRKRRKTRRKQQEASEKRNQAELSDMSISPSVTRDTSRDLSKSHLPLETCETSTERLSNQRSGLESRAVSEGERTTTVLDEDIDNIAKRYTTPSNVDGLFSSSSHSWSTSGVTGSRDYGILSSEERFSGYSSVDTFRRNNYLDGYGRSLDVDIRIQQARSYSMQGQEDPLQRSRFSLGSSDSALGCMGLYPSSFYGFSSSMTGSSTMQRYAPRLDETNYARGPGNRSPGAPLPGGRSSIFDAKGMRRDMAPDSLGFAAGPQHPFPRQGSGGWLND